MGFAARAKSSSEALRMGLFLVFFPEDENAVINQKTHSHNNNPLPLPSSSSSSSPLFRPTIKALLRRTNSSHLLSRAQSTISICALLIFLTILLFSLSTLEPPPAAAVHRRHLSSYRPPLHSPKERLVDSSPWSLFSIFRRSNSRSESPNPPPPSHALQGMGKLHRRGTKAMNDLAVAHIAESVTRQDLKLFLRLLHRSGLTSRSDLVLVFPSSSDFNSAVREENDSFLKLVRHYIEFNFTGGFDVTQFIKWSNRDKESGEPVWGRRIRTNSSEQDDTESIRLSYGSVVSFDVDELDPVNSLAGFLDHVPMSLRRWACYPMLLGRLRRNFKHIMLVDVKEMLLLGDPLDRVRSRSPESVILSIGTTQSPNKHSKRNYEECQSQRRKHLNPSIIVGGTRGVRRLSAAMLTEIARVAMQSKKKDSVSESGLFNQLVGNEHILKNVDFIISSESVPVLSSLTWPSNKPGSSPPLPSHSVVRRGNSNRDSNSTTIMKYICSFPLDSLAYSDC